MVMDHRQVTMAAFDKFTKKYGVSKGSVLDVGCRYTETKNALEERGFRWSGIDILPDPKAEHVIMRGAMEDMPFQSRMFDVVFVCHSLEHCEKPVHAVREFGRVLKDTGFLFISMPKGTRKMILESDDDHIFVLNEMQIERLLRYTGMDTVEVWEEVDPQQQGSTAESLIVIGKKSRATGG